MVLVYYDNLPLRKKNCIHSFFYKKLAIRNRGLKWQKKLRNFRAGLGLT